MRALVLAGGYPQISLICKLKERGIYTILADWNENPVARGYADKFYQVSTLDVEAIKNVATDEEVSFLITVCTDQALLTVAKVSEDLELPCYIDYQTALNVTNKQYMKGVFFQNKIPTAQYLILKYFNENEICKLSFPLIVKPVDCNSSKGVVKVSDLDELQVAFERAKELSRTKTVILEEFIEGRELSVDAFVHSGKAYILDITISEKIKDHKKFIINRTWHPAPINNFTMKKISLIVQQIADSFEIKNAPMLIQMIERNGNIFVLEFSARTGGGVKFITIKEQSGFDVIDAIIDLTLGKKPQPQLQPPLFKYMVDEYIYCKPGKFDHLDSFYELKQDGILLDYYLFKWKGATFDSISSSGDRVAAFSIVSNSLMELKRKHEEANMKLAVRDICGNDIMRHDLLDIHG